MDYKISETPLKLKEYGRNIQGMVEYIVGIEDREKRSQLAHEVVEIMGNLHPQLKDFPDYKQKLWDHLYLVSDYALDIDCDFPMPNEEKRARYANYRLPYYRETPNYRQYGRNVDLMIKAAVHLPEGRAKEAYINQIANTMKQFLRNIDKDSVPEHVIVEHINEISGNRLSVNVSDIFIYKEVPSASKNDKNDKNKGKHSNNKRGGSNRGGGHRGGKMKKSHNKRR